MDPIPTIAEAAKLIAAKKLSPVELTKDCIARMEAYDDTLHAFILPTEERALADARAAETRVMAGNAKGPLDGIPIGHKDIYSTAGIRTTGHSRLLENNVPVAGRHLGAQMGRGRRGADGQAFDPRVRHGRAVVRPAMAAGAQSVESRAFHCGFFVRHWCGGGVGHDPGRHRFRHRRFDPRARGAVRHRRHQAHLWSGQPRWRAAAVVQHGPRRSAGLDRRGLRAAAPGDGRPRSRRSCQRRSSCPRLRRPISARA